MSTASCVSRKIPVLVLLVAFFLTATAQTPPPTDGTFPWRKNFLISTYDPYRTYTAAEPIYAGGGQFREQWPLLPLGGLIPFNFTLLYAPDLQYRSAINDGRVQFPPSLNNRAFSTNTVYRLVVFENRSETGNPLYANVFLADDAVALKEVEPGVFSALDPLNHQLKRVGSTFFFLDFRLKRVLVFRSRTLGFETTAPDGTRYYIRACGEVEYILDRNGNSLAFTYNGDNNPTRIEDGLGRTLILSYRPGGYFDRHLAAVSDGHGRIVRFTFQEMTCKGQTAEVLASFSDVLGRTTSFEYFSPETTTDCNLVKRIIRPLGNSHIDQDWTTNPTGYEAIGSQRDAFGNETTLGFSRDEDENLGVTFTFPGGATRSFVHLDQRYPLSYTDEAGKPLTIAYNDYGQIASMTDTLGQTVSLAPAAGGKVQSFTDPLGRVTSFTYEMRDQVFTPPDKRASATFTFWDLVRVDNPDGTAEAYTRDPNGNILTWTDAGGNAWQFTYNGRGQVLTVTNPAGGMQASTYNADATLASVTDPDTGITSCAYDAFKRLQRVTYADGSFREAVRDLAGQQTSLTDEAGGVTARAYDANGNLSSLTDPAGKAYAFEYDAMDRRTAITDRAGHKTAFGYDALGRRTSITPPAGPGRAFTYDPRGRVTAETVGGATWQSDWDDESRLTGLTAPAGDRYSFSLDAWGGLTGLTDPLGNTTTTASDAMGRLTSTTDPLGRETILSYDPRGLLSGVTLPGGLAAAYSYDALGNLTGVTDPAGTNLVFARSLTGRLLSQTDSLGRTTLHTYDNRGWPDVATFADGSALDRTYDAKGRLLRQQYSAGPDLAFGRDSLGRLTTADGVVLTYDGEGRVVSAVSQGETLTASYDAAGRLLTLGYPGGVTVTYRYHPVTGLLDRVEDNLSGSWVEIGYDADLRPAAWTRSNGVDGSLARDAAGQVTRVREGNFLDLTYAYDAAGRVVAIEGSAPLDPESHLAAGEEAWTFDAAGQQTGIGYTYDARGRQTAAPGHAWAWDGASRLTAADGVQFTWDGRGRLAGLNDGGGAVVFCSHPALRGSPVVAEKTLDSVWSYNIWLPTGELLYRFRLDGKSVGLVHFYHFDRNGNTIALSDPAGRLTDSYAYDPYGRLLAHQGGSPQPFTLLGRQGARQEGTGGTLHFAGARVYDASAGRFLTPDPAGFIRMEPRSLNPYQYAYQNPTTLVDAGGFDPDYPDSWELHQMGISGSMVDALEELEDWIDAAADEMDDLEEDIEGYEILLAAAQQGDTWLFQLAATGMGLAGSEEDLTHDYARQIIIVMQARKELARHEQLWQKAHQRFHFFDWVWMMFWKQHGNSFDCMFPGWQNRLDWVRLNNFPRYFRWPC